MSRKLCACDNLLNPRGPIKRESAEDMGSKRGNGRLRNIWFLIVLLQTLILCYLLFGIHNMYLQRPAQKHSCLHLSKDTAHVSSEPWKFGELGQLLSSPSRDRYQVKPTYVELHNTRKLVLYTVHMINERTKANPEGCIKWWANPLTASRISSTLINSRRTRKWNLEFDLEPGRIRVAVVLFQNRTNTNRRFQNQTNTNTNGTSINLRQQKKFTLYSVKVLNSNETSIERIYFRDAEESETKDPQIVSENLVNLCLCKDELEEANRRTKEARAAWNELDPELSMWPPDASFIVTDYIDYLDPNFFLISPEDRGYCGPKTRMIVGIHSAPSHFELRLAIRVTYGRKEIMRASNASLVFFLGTVDDQDLQNTLNLEAEEYMDIVQANFADTYHNLTLKRLTVYQWIYLKCGTGSWSQRMPEYLLKSDDDFLLNVEAALILGDANRNSSGLIGNVHCGYRPIRDPTEEKHYLPRYIWLPETYNGYLSGLTTLMRTDLIPNMLQESLTTPIVHIDDVYSHEILHVIPERSHLFPSGPQLPGDGGLNPCDWNRMISSILPGEDHISMEVFWKLKKEIRDSKKCDLSESDLDLVTIPVVC